MPLFLSVEIAWLRDYIAGYLACIYNRVYFHVTRIISIRRANRNERKIYQEKCKKQN